MEKRCTKCHKVKPVSEFHRLHDGYQSRCKACRLPAARSDYLKHAPMRRAQKAKYEAANADVIAERRRSRAAARSERRAAWVNENKRINRQVESAHNKVKYALRTGKLHKKPCEVCGDRRVQAHHDDYSKPLEVVWLCSAHHHERHHVDAV